MRVYTIAHRKRECYGHGDFGDELKICRTGPYGFGEFPPVFGHHQDAINYMKMHYDYGDVTVVELEFRPDVTPVVFKKVYK